MEVCAPWGRRAIAWRRQHRGAAGADVPGAEGSPRAGRVDLLPVVIFAVLLPIGSRGASHGQTGRAALDAFAYVLCGIAALGLGARRAAPVPTLAIEITVVATWLGRDYPYGPMLLAVALSAYTVGSRSDRRMALGAAAVGGTALAVGAAVGHHPRGLNDWVAVVAQFGWVLIPVVVGTFARLSRLASARADSEAARLRAEQARLQVAREVHDVVGHGLSVISLQAGVALHVLTRRPEQAQIALEAIRRTSIDALAELRETLAITTDAGAAHREPLTGLARLSGLARDVRLCGLPLEVETVGTRRPLPADVDLAAFRVAREGLTNVLRHAGPARARVTVGYHPAAVTVDVVDEPLESAGAAAGPVTASVTGSGRGLAGLRASVTGLGGTLTAGPAQDGGWTVRAVLPTPAAAAPMGSAVPAGVSEPGR
jgi:signal transduction histidine kinase